LHGTVEIAAAAPAHALALRAAWRCGDGLRWLAGQIPPSLAAQGDAPSLRMRMEHAAAHADAIGGAATRARHAPAHGRSGACGAACAAPRAMQASAIGALRVPARTFAHKKGRSLATAPSVPRRPGESRLARYLTSNSCAVPAGWPFTVTSALYLPAGQPLALVNETLVVSAPAVVSVALCSPAVWPSWNSSLAPIAVLVEDPSVFTETMMVSLLLSVVSGATVLSAPAVLPTVTDATVTAPALAAAGAVSAGPGIASVGADEVGSGVAVWLCSCFLQPARASVPTSASSSGEVNVFEWIFMRWCSLDGMTDRARGSARQARAGSFKVCPG
jgi:hypothetical protein